MFLEKQVKKTTNYSTSEEAGGHAYTMTYNTELAKTIPFTECKIFFKTLNFFS